MAAELSLSHWSHHHAWILCPSSQGAWDLLCPGGPAALGDIQSLCPLLMCSVMRCPSPWELCTIDRLQMLLMCLQLSFFFFPSENSLLKSFVRTNFHAVNHVLLLSFPSYFYWTWRLTEVCFEEQSHVLGVVALASIPIPADQSHCDLTVFFCQSEPLVFNCTVVPGPVACQREMDVFWEPQKEGQSENHCDCIALIMAYAEVMCCYLWWSNCYSLS